MRVEVRGEAFEPWRELERYQVESLQGSAAFGATAAFVGTMRDFNEGDDVRGMHLEHYPGMTEKHLGEIVRGAAKQFGLLDALVIHRVGNIAPGDPIVLVAVWSAHRAAAFSACRSVMEALKSQAPFWKKETLADRERWVARNTAG